MHSLFLSLSSISKLVDEVIRERAALIPLFLPFVYLFRILLENYDPHFPKSTAAARAFIANLLKTNNFPVLESFSGSFPSGLAPLLASQIYYRRPLVQKTEVNNGT